MNKSIVKRCVTSVLVLLASALLPRLVFAQNVADNIRPVGSICLVGQACVGTVAGAMAEASPEASVADSAEPDEAAEDAKVAETAAGSAADTSQVSDGFNAEQKYMGSCLACHSTGAAGAPKVGAGMMSEWEPRLEKGLDAIVSNAINGVNAMPAKGMCFDCSADDIRALVEYMLETSQ